MNVSFGYRTGGRYSLHLIIYHCFCKQLEYCQPKLPSQSKHVWVSVKVELPQLDSTQPNSTQTIFSNYSRVSKAGIYGVE